MNVEILGSDSVVSMNGSPTPRFFLPRVRRRPVVFDRTGILQSEVVISGQGYRQPGITRTGKRRNALKEYDRAKTISRARYRLFSGYSGFGEERLGVAPAAVAKAGITVVETGKTLLSWREKNIAKARAEDAAKREKAYNNFVNKTGDIKWAAIHIVKNRTFYAPEIVASAWAWRFGKGKYSDPMDPNIQAEALRWLIGEFNYAKEQAGGDPASPQMKKNIEWSDVGELAGFVVEHPEYYTREMYERCRAFWKGDLAGKYSLDPGDFSQPSVAVPEAAPVPVTTPEIKEDLLAKAGMLETGLPIMVISGVVLFVSYKLFFEKKSGRKTTRKRR